MGGETPGPHTDCSKNKTQNNALDHHMKAVYQFVNPEIILGVQADTSPQLSIRSANLICMS